MRRATAKQSHQNEASVIFCQIIFQVLIPLLWRGNNLQYPHLLTSQSQSSIQPRFSCYYLCGT